MELRLSLRHTGSGIVISGDTNPTSDDRRVPWMRRADSRGLDARLARQASGFQDTPLPFTTTAQLIDLATQAKPAC
jgi:hypothetical protein